MNTEEKGYINVPYIMETNSTSINGETVWYKNRWKNFLLKLKHLIIKPNTKYSKYSNNNVNSSYYITIKRNKKWIKQQEL